MTHLGTPMRLLPLLALVLAASGCQDLCEPDDENTVTLGEGVGGAFEPFTDDSIVELTPAPQGGFGVSIVIGTAGLRTEQANTAMARLDVIRDGTEDGTFLSEGLQLLCVSPEEGGRIHGQVVGFDPDVYASNDDLLALDGAQVDLQVTVTDSAGAESVGISTVTVDVGG